MSFRSKVENIWYHYKSYIIVSLFLLGTLIVCLYSCVTKPQFDIQVYYVTGGSSVYTEQLKWIETAVAAHCPDVNEDGEVTVAVTSLRVGPNTDAVQRAQYLNAVQAGEIMLFFGDQEGINFLYQNGYIQPLTDFSEELDGDGYAWKVNGTPFSAQTEGFDVFGETEVYLSLRLFDNTWSSARAAVKQNYETARAAIHSIVSYSTSPKE